VFNYHQHSFPFGTLVCVGLLWPDDHDLLKGTLMKTRTMFNNNNNNKKKKKKKNQEEKGL